MNSTSIKNLQERVHAIAKSKGWWNDFPQPGTRAHSLEIIVLLALVSTEASEAIEAVREGHLEEWFREDGKPEGLPAELADVVIRCLDMAEGLGIDLEGAIERKVAYNAGRAFKHGGKLV